MDVEIVQPSADVHVAVAGIGFERSVEGVGIDTAITGPQAQFAGHTPNVDLAISRADVGIGPARNFHFQADRPVVASEVKVPARAADDEFHPSAGLKLA